MTTKTNTFKKADWVVTRAMPDEGYPEDSLPMRIVEGPYPQKYGLENDKVLPAYTVDEGAGSYKIAYAEDLKPASKLDPKTASHDGTRRDMERAQRVLGCFAARTRDAFKALTDRALGAGQDPVAIARKLASLARTLAEAADAEGDAQRAYWGN